MRVLTVRQPWAWAIVHGGKDVENRVRNIAGSYRGPVAIHAGLAQFEDDGQYREVKRAIVSELNGWPAGDSELWSADSIDADDPRFVYGSIIGVVELADVHEGPNTASDPMRAVRSCFLPGKPFGLCSPWAERDVHHLVLTNPRPLAQPIPYRGALGLRNLDPATIAEIERIGFTNPEGVPA